jgi:uncharacterized protein (DUF608 family)
MNNPVQPRDGALPRREFLKRSVATAGGLAAAGTPTLVAAEGQPAPAARVARPAAARRYNTAYAGLRLNRVAFPMGGIGAGMICLEGTGALSHFSLRNKPEVYNEPCVFAAVAIRGKEKLARVIEGQVPGWKLYGAPGTGNGAAGSSFGLPRFGRATFEAKFPFGTVGLVDRNLPLEVQVTGWSPFEPGDADNASLPVAALEYKFINRGKEEVEAVFSFNAKNFMAVGSNAQGIKPLPGGFALWGAAPKDKAWEQGAFSATVSEPEAKVNHAWFRGGWWDGLTLAWKDVAEGACYDRPPITDDKPAPGASLFVPFKLAPGESRTVTLRLAWHVGVTNLRIGGDPKDAAPGDQPTEANYRPWYTSRFSDIEAITTYWRDQYAALREKSKRFSDCFQDTTLPSEVVEAVAANLTILKSPTVLRQADGRLWAWEGCGDNNGCCHGSCTHVWNYAQAIPHLFPSLERTLRETEFGPSQDTRGHQTFRSNLPIRPVVHDFHAAADGQLGGIMKVYREWRVGGDSEWLKRLWPKVKASLDYCIETWDPGRKGVVEEPHHNTYDIEFWGPDGMCTSFYLGALQALILMGEALKEDVAAYKDLLDKGTKVTETDLYDGEYFIQKIEWKNLKAANPIEVKSFGGDYSPEARALLEKEGPKYQYGRGCLSDGVLGSWLALVCGVGQVLDRAKVASHLKSVHKYNLRRDLSQHANPQRPAYAAGSEGGLLICSWPKGGQLSLPFVYSDEVWTGIEYQVASHLMCLGMVEEGLEIVRICRNRYDGRVRNPFNEYECGHWYARAMSSYGLIHGLSGARYDAVEKVLYLRPTVKGDFRAFLSTGTGYGTVGVKDGKAFLEVRSGQIEVKETRYEPVA